MTRQRTVTLLSAAAAIAASAGIAGAVTNSTTTGTDTTPQPGSYGTTTTGTHPGDRGGPGRGGPGGPGHRGGPHRRPLTDAQLTQIATKLGISSADLKAALKKTRPAKPPKEQREDHRGPGNLAADLATALGVETADVQKILEANRPERPSTPPAPGTAPAKPDLSKLVTALATGLNKDEATVQAAFDKLQADHKADHPKGPGAGRGPDEMFKALAAELKLDEADVKAAFESVLGKPKLKLKTTK